MWVLVNYLTFGNLSHFYSSLKDKEKQVIAKHYAIRYINEYNMNKSFIFTIKDLEAALKIFNLVRNKCAHDERLYNSTFENILVSNVAKHLNIEKYDNTKLIVLIMYFKILLSKNNYKEFNNELLNIINKYKEEFKVISFFDILEIMGINLETLKTIEEINC